MYLTCLHKFKLYLKSYLHSYHIPGHLLYCKQPYEHDFICLLLFQRCRRMIKILISNFYFIFDIDNATIFRCLYTKTICHIFTWLPDIVQTRSGENFYSPIWQTICLLKNTFRFKSIFKGQLVQKQWTCMERYLSSYPTSQNIYHKIKRDLDKLGKWSKQIGGWFKS